MSYKYTIFSCCTVIMYFFFGFPNIVYIVVYIVKILCCSIRLYPTCANKDTHYIINNDIHISLQLRLIFLFQVEQRTVEDMHIDCFQSCRMEPYSKNLFITNHMRLQQFPMQLVTHHHTKYRISLCEESFFFLVVFYLHVGGLFSPFGGL